MEDAIPVACSAAETGDLLGRLLEWRAGELRQRIRATDADSRRGAIPGTALRTKH